uniref:TatD related DNase n=1 Tax=Phaeomonas parva TaxID=124430 RepID=A0A7S1U5L7_9STRA
MAALALLSRGARGYVPRAPRALRTRLLASYVDAHTHLVHRKFDKGEGAAAAERAAAVGVSSIMVNGLRPENNREVLEFCAQHKNALPCCGIYPLDACSNVITPELWSHDFDPPEPFDVDAEVDWIREQAKAGTIAAIGEVGIDAYYMNDPVTMAEQERVLHRLIDVALETDLALILHTRKAEARIFEMLQERGVKKAVFHCYMGKLKLGKRIAEAGYYISIPSAVARPHDTFVQMATRIPLERILTETDAPYMGPDKGERNEPATVPRAVAKIAEVRGVSVEEAAAQIQRNFRTVFGIDAGAAEEAPVAAEEQDATAGLSESVKA